MGYALLFARSLHNTAKKNQLTYETMSIQNQKESITNQLGQIQQQENSVKQMQQYQEAQNANAVNNTENANNTEETNNANAVQNNPMQAYRTVAYQLTLNSLQIQKTLLNSIAENLDVRLSTIKTQLAAISAEESSVNESLQNAVQNSAPHYVGR
jgi:DNA repair exonuclease SbcCD ATPase subunit